MSQTLHLSGERAIGVEEIYEFTTGSTGLIDGLTTYTVFDLDLVTDTGKDLWDWEFDTEKETLAVARNYIESLGLEVNQ